MLKQVSLSFSSFEVGRVFRRSTFLDSGKEKGLSKMGKDFLFLIMATFYTFPVSQVDARNIDGAPSLTPIGKGMDLCISQ